jgi:prophage antirepressor-like protein
MAEKQPGTSVLVFQDIEFDIVDIHNVPWLRANQIGLALEYKNPDLSLNKLYRENADEFTDEMTQLVELDTAGGRQQVRIFSPRGCYLIGMLSRIERAKDFRRWVLDVLEGRAMPREVGRLTVPQQIAMHRLRVSLLKELKAETTLGMRRALHGQVSHVSRMLSLPIPLLEQIGKDDPQEKLPGV